MKVRDCVLGGPGLHDLVVELDYSQLEVFVTAIRSKCPDLIAMLKGGGDLHAETAAQRMGCDPSEVPSDVRRKAKPVNFQLAYGGTAYGISQKTGMPKEECQAFIDGYYNRFPGVGEYQEELIATAERNGQPSVRRDQYNKPAKEWLLEEPHGKSYLFIQETRETRRGPTTSFPVPKLKNWPVQGLASDIVRAAMAELWRQRRNLFLPVYTGPWYSQLRLAAQVHDSVVLRLLRSPGYVPETLDDSELARLQIIRHIMRSFPKQKLQALGLEWPEGLDLRVDCEIGRSWATAKPFNLEANAYQD